VNITNGVTPRRWMVLSNPGLSELITSAIGEGWITDLERLRDLEPLADDPAFGEQWRQVKRTNKQKVCAFYSQDACLLFNPGAMFDVQVKRIHEYKRQHLNLLHIITLYHRLKNNPDLDLPPRVFVFGGKAAPGYLLAKLIIKLINAVAEVINGDPEVNGRLQILFVPNFNVQIGHFVYPMADLSEQISLAGKEASGTGNMKFAMNGALTIGTLDGANVEIRDQVGADNFFLFGMNVDEVAARWRAGYQPRAIYDTNEHLRAAIHLIAIGHFSHGDRELFRPLIDSMLNHDPYMVFADYQAYVDCQQRVGEVFLDRERWTRMSILNVSRVGKFSSDRSIAEYCEKIWQVKGAPVDLKWECLPKEGIIFPQLGTLS
jgi:starch phosphorylase